MKERRITIEIGPEGDITADADGFAGDACLQDLERLLAGLAPGTAALARKPDDGVARRVTTRALEVGKKR